MPDAPRSAADVQKLAKALVERDELIASLRSVIASLEGKIAALESTLTNHANENELLKRRLFGTKSERGGTSELQLVLGDLLSQQADLKKQLDALIAKDEAEADAPLPETPPPPATPPDKARAKPKGRADLSLSSLPKMLVDIRDPQLDATAKLIDWEVSYQLFRQRQATKVLVKRVAKYEVVVRGEPTVVATELPPTLFPRGMLHTSMLAWIVVQKYALGVPHYRLEQHLAGQGAPIDRSTMSRNTEEVGSTLGATVVHAMMRDAIESCQVLSTDATGAAVQPGPHEKGLKQACKKGHFFTIVADCDHVLFAYTERHTQEAVASLFKGFKGYLQSDASSVYDILERGPPSADTQVSLVGCFAHARRYFFEAAICKYPIGVAGLTRIRAIYAADDALAKLPPIDRHRERLTRVLPLVDEFFSWAHATARTTAGRTLATKALGYAVNQEQELRRVFEDGRLPLDNTRSERALRKVVVGRKNWMFYGSDLHANAAAAIFSVIASCRLHGIDPEQYLDEVLRVLPVWPKERHLELAPKYWNATRARLDASELELPFGEITVPSLGSVLAGG